MHFDMQRFKLLIYWDLHLQTSPGFLKDGMKNKRIFGLPNAFAVKLATLCHHYLKVHIIIFLCCNDFTAENSSCRDPCTRWPHLAVCGGDHVDVVADQLEGEAPVHEGEASLRTETQTETQTETVAADQTTHPLA